MTTARITQLGARALALTVLSAFSLAAGAVSTHHYVESDTTQRGAQAQEVQSANDTEAVPATGPAAVAGLADDGAGPTEHAEYIHVPKVGDVRVDTGQS